MIGGGISAKKCEETQEIDYWNSVAEGSRCRYLGALDNLQVRKAIENERNFDHVSATPINLFKVTKLYA